MCHARWRCVLRISMFMVAMSFTVSSLAEDDLGFTSMFNGVDLTGWEGQPGWWSVQNGLLTAESTVEKPCTRSHYLYWSGGEPADFDMRCRFRISDHGNSGIQFRSERRDNWDTWGYQADMDGAGEYMGCLYQHERGLVAQRGQKVHIDKEGKKTITTFADAAELLRNIHREQWNSYRILAKGPCISMWINDVLMCEVEDHQPRLGLRRGIIALQMHQGPPMKIEYSDLKIKVDSRP